MKVFGNFEIVIKNIFFLKKTKQKKMKNYLNDNDKDMLIVGF